MDNHGSHNNLIDPLGQVRIEGFPPLITSTSQPMDMGVIKTAKTYYRYELLSNSVCVALGQLPSDFLAGGSLAAGKKADVRDALHIFSRAWAKVTPQCIVRCWVKAGILPGDMQSSATRSHGKTDMDSLLDGMRALTHLIPGDTSNPELQEVVSAVSASDGAIEHWLALESDPMVREAMAMDAINDDNGDDDSV